MADNTDAKEDTMFATYFIHNTHWRISLLNSRKVRANSRLFPVPVFWCWKFEWKVWKIVLFIFSRKCRLAVSVDLRWLVSLKVNFEDKSNEVTSVHMDVNPNLTCLAMKNLVWLFRHSFTLFLDGFPNLFIFTYHISRY